MDEAAVDVFLARAARGAPQPWPSAVDWDLEHRVLERARQQRVDGLLAGLGDAALAAKEWPPSLRAALREGARALTLRETVRGEALRRVLAAWQRADIRTLLFKGAAYAPRLYPAPHLRGGADHDLWVGRSDRARAEHILESLSYERGPRIRGEMIENQAPYARRVSGVRHVVDLHWEVSNRRAIAEAFPFDEAWARSEPISEPTPGVRAVDRVDALLIACAHAPGHHHRQPLPLVWHLDIHVIASNLDAAGWTEVVERCRRRSVCSLVHRGLLEARTRFETSVPDAVVGALEEAAGEASARLFSAPLGLLAEDVRASRGARRRLRLLREAAFPDTAYLEARYGSHPSLVGPLLWVRRWLEGAARAVGRRTAPEGRASPLRLMRVLLAPRLRPHVPLLALGCIATALQAAALLALPVHAGRLTEAWSTGHGAAVLHVALPAALVGLYVLSGAFARLALGRVALRLARALREALAERLRILPLRWLERRPSGTLLSWLAAESETLAATTAELPATLLPALGAAGIAAFLLGKRDPWIVVGALLASPLVALLLARVVSRLRKTAGRTVDAHAALLALLQEQIEGLATIRLFVQEEKEAERLRAAEERLARAREDQLAGQVWLGPLSRVVAAGSVFAAIGFAALRPDAAPRTSAEWVTTLLYGLALARPLAVLATLTGQLALARAALDRFGRAWRAAPEPRGSGLGERLFGSAEWHDVYFRYPGRPLTLRGASLRVAPGEIVALVGPNGSGKTTLARLCTRLDEPDAGRITIGGRDLRTLDPRAVRRSVSLVAQQTRLFDRSLRDNIAFGAPDASQREIEEAAQRAGIHHFIATLPQGYDTPVGDNGVALSGGQRQRVALARALLTDPAVLILDEATSMLDADGERSFLERNRSWLRRRAVLLVTHRPASLAIVDRVVALAEGRAVERSPSPAWHRVRPYAADIAR